MKVLRSTLVAAVAVFAAACGDKVNVVGPTTTTPTPDVTAITVAPTAATLSVGQTVNFTAAVTAVNGAAATVTWSSTDASKVSVSATGVATAVAATPGVAICATSTVNVNTKGCASVVVTAQAAAIPASVSIQSITATGNTNTTLNPAAVAGNIDVRVNVNPGNQTVSKVVLVLGGTRADSQTFTAAQSAALRFAADQAAETQSTFPQILFSINTAAYNATTGAPKFLNGAKSISVQLYTTQAGAAAAAATATEASTYTFANVDGFQVSTSGGNTAVDANGFRWNGNGSLTISAIPVIYSGVTLGTVTATLGGACGALLNPGAVATSGSATTLTAGAYTVTLTLTGVQSAAACATTTPNIPVITATNATGDVLTLGGTSGALNAQAGIRWDNVAPAAPAGSTFAAVAAGNAANIRINVNPNGRANGWINDAVVFNAGATSATSNNYLCNASAAGFNTCLAADTLPRDAGVGGTVFTVQVGATKAAAYAAAGLTSAASLAPSATNAGYCAIAFSADALGNKTTLTTAQQATACGAEVNSAAIGVDRYAPTIAASGGLAANARINGANIGGEFTVTVADTGLVGNSGLLPATPVKMQLTRVISAGANGPGVTSARNADATAATTAGVLSGTGVAAAAPLYSTTITAVTQAGYYTNSASATDAAGNTTTLSAYRTIVFDGTAGSLVVSGAAVPVSVTALGWSANAFVSDALDIAAQWFSADYATLNAVGAFTTGPSAAPVRFAQAQTAVNGFGPATSFLNTNVALSQGINLPFYMQANAAATLYAMSGVEANAVNQGNMQVTGTSAIPTIPAGTAITTGGTQMSAFATPTFSVASNIISSGVTTAPTAANPASGTLTVTTTGPTATFNNPFSRVDIYAAATPLGVVAGAATPTEWRLVGSVPAASATLVDNGVTRVFTYAITLNAATLYTQLGLSATTTQNITAIGVNANGTVGMITGVYSLQIVK